MLCFFFSAGVVCVICNMNIVHTVRLSLLIRYSTCTIPYSIPFYQIIPRISPGIGKFSIAVAFKLQPSNFPIFLTWKELNRRTLLFFWDICSVWYGFKKILSSWSVHFLLFSTSDPSSYSASISLSLLPFLPTLFESTLAYPLSRSSFFHSGSLLL